MREDEVGVVKSNNNRIGHSSRVDLNSLMRRVKEEEKKSKRTIDLPVSAPFHCSLMLPAQKNMINLIQEANNAFLPNYFFQ